jgi:Amt family ammonium transporter
MTTFLLLGRSMLEIGSVKPKFSRHVASKNLFQLIVSCICFFAVGHALSSDAFGGFYGTRQFLMISQSDFINWTPMFISAWHCVSIASSALAERTRTSIHILLAVYLVSLVYPIVVSWGQGGGWLSRIGFVDCCGCGAIHVVAGTVGLVGTLRLGPRLGIFNDKMIVGMSRSLSLSEDKDLEINTNLNILKRL